MYAVVRSDLKMTAGKAAAQAGHAFVNSFSKAPEPLRSAYAAEIETSKIVLTAADQCALLRVLSDAKESGLPCAPVWEAQDDAPQGLGIITAIGIGPAPRDQIRAVTKKLKAM